MKRIGYILVFLSAVLALHAESGVALQQRQNQRSRLYDIYFLDAMLERQKGHHDAAFDLLMRCREIHPDASETYFFMAQYLDEMKRRDKALDNYKKAYELEPDNQTYMETLTSAYIAAGKYAEAIEVAEHLYEKDKSRLDILEMLYRLHMQLKQYDEAIGILNRMEEIDGKSERLSLSKSNLFIQMDNHEAAIKEVKALAEQYPNDLNYRTLYANTLMMDEQREEAVKVLKSVLNDEANNYRAQMALRTYYLMEQDTLKADSLTRSILLNPNSAKDDKVNLLRQEIGHSEAHGGDSTRVLQLFSEMLSQPQPDADMAELCAAYMNLKQMPRDSVRYMLEKALQLDPAKASARLQLVQYAWEDDDNDRVVAICQDARQYNPEEMAFYYYQGMAYYRKEDHDHALEAFKNGISVINEDSNPAIVSDFYAVMGDLLHRKGDEKGAFEAYDSCLQWKPDNIGCLNNYAYFLSVKGEQLDRAEEMSYKTIKAEPKNATFLDTYAWIMFKQQRYAEARIYIDQAIQNDSVLNSEVLEHAGDIYAMNGDLDTAVDYWQRALTDNPGNKILIRKIKRKKYLK